MDGNKDEALRCIRIAEEAIASGNRYRALKFIKIARRLNHNLSVDGLLDACENLGSEPNGSGTGGKRFFYDDDDHKTEPLKPVEGFVCDPDYSEEHVETIRQIKRNRDYYDVLGVDKACSVEEIRRAYKKLSLKVHPDKNKAPGSEEAFKKLSKAFKCLSHDDSRRQYDQVGLPDEFEYNHRHNVRHRRRRYENGVYDDNFNPDEMFRTFFSHRDMFRASNVYRRRETGSHPREGSNEGWTNLMMLLQLLPFLLIFLLAYLPFSEPEYSLHQSYYYQVPVTTEQYGIEYFVKSSAFDDSYPHGSPSRAKIEDNVMKDYKYMLWRSCNAEMQRRHWNKNLHTPHCDKLRNYGFA